MENFIYYSQLTLLILSFVALALALLFRIKLKVFKKAISGCISANEFSKSFVVFNPYPESRKTLHEFLSLLPLTVFFFGIILAFALIYLLEAELMLSFFVAIIGINLVVIEDAFEVYGNSKAFTSALKQSGAKLGVGDLKVLHLIEQIMPKISNYYLLLSFAMMGSSIAFPYFYYPTVWLFARYVGFILQASVVGGPASYVVAVFIFAIPTVLMQVLLSKVKGKIFKYEAALPRLHVSETEEILNQ